MFIVLNRKLHIREPVVTFTAMIEYSLPIRIHNYADDYKNGFRMTKRRAIYVDRTCETSENDIKTFGIILVLIAERSKES